MSAEVYRSSNVYKLATTGTNPAFVTILNRSNNMNIGYGDTGFSVDMEGPFTANLYLNSNLIGSYESGNNGEPEDAMYIPFSGLINGDTYALIIGAPPAWTGTTVSDSIGENCTFTYTSSSTYPIAPVPYTFNQAMSTVSTSAMGITEILLIVIGVLILVAVTIVVYAKSRYELE